MFVIQVNDLVSESFFVQLIIFLCFILCLKQLNELHRYGSFTVFDF